MTIETRGRQPSRQYLPPLVSWEDFLTGIGEDGRYTPAPTSDDGIYTSTVLPRLRLRVSWLWQAPPPTLDEALDDLPYPGP